VCISNTREKPIDLTSVPQSVMGLQMLANHFCWKQAVKLSSKLEAAEPVKNGALSQVTKLRLDALFRTRLFDELVMETNKIIMAEQQRIQSSATEGTIGDQSNDGDLILSMKLLQAEIKAIAGRGEDALGYLRIIQQSLSASSAPLLNGRFWSWRIRCVIVNAAVRQRYWRIVIKELLSMSKDVEEEIDSVGSEPPLSLLRAHVVILCRISRVLLQVW
jgi:hypothetical protein